jgi:hypothetical protein
MNGARFHLSRLWSCFKVAATRTRLAEVKAFVSENISLVIHPDEIISRRAIGLLEHHAFSPWTSGGGRDYCRKRS